MSQKTDHRARCQADARALDKLARPLLDAGVGIREAYRRACDKLRMSGGKDLTSYR